MGYYSRITGAITFDPPLPFAEWAKGPLLAQRSEFPEVLLAAGASDNPGEVDAIVPATAAAIKAYDLEAEVAVIVAALGDGHTFGGFLEVSGEEQGDLCRLYVRDGQVVRVTPRIVWPEEESDGDAGGG